MKKIILSVAVATMAFSTAALAADKDIDVKVSGQTVLYYNTLGNNATNGADMFSGDKNGNNKASFGVQLNFDADLKNNFTFGSTLNYLGTAGLEKEAVGAVMQTANNSNNVYVSQMFIAKKMANTTVKIGRQELPKSLSPFAFSEGWNVFKNTFDAILMVNSDIPDTTVVGAYVGSGNGNGFSNDMSNFRDLSVVTDAVGATNVGGAAYMLTVQNKSIPMTTITASYYDLANVGTNFTGNNGDVGATALWLDAKIAGKKMPLGLKVGLQGGQISADDLVVNGVTAKFADTVAMGVKIGLKPVDALSLCIAYTSVDGDDNKVNVAMKNTTGVKTPLYTQMVGNQNAIALDSNTIMLKAAYNAGDAGTIILQGTQSDTGKSNLNTFIDAAGVTQGSDFTDLELIYKVKVGAVNLLAAYISQDWDKNAGATAAADHNDIVRFVGRYNF